MTCFQSMPRQDYASLRLVNRAFHAAVSAAVTSLQPSKHIQNNALEALCMAFPHLTSLNLLNCFSVTAAPSIGTLTTLQALNIFNLKYLKELPKSISLLQSLTAFSIRSCDRIIEVPDGISALRNLKTLDLVLPPFPFPHAMTLPLGISELTGLRRLQLRCSLGGGEALAPIHSLASLIVLALGYQKELPEGIDRLTSLRRLDLSDSPDLKVLPRSLCRMTSLLHLDLGLCRVLAPPEGLGELTSLRTLSLCDEVWKLYSEHPAFLALQVMAPQLVVSWRDRAHRGSII